MSMFRRKRKPPAAAAAAPRAMSMDEFTRQLAAEMAAQGRTEPDEPGHRLGAAPPSDIGEADVDVAVRWVERNVPEAEEIADVEYVGEVDGHPMYRVRYWYDDGEPDPPD